MMIKLVLSLTLVALYFSHDVNGCNILQSLKVKSQWSQAFGFTTERESINQDVWRAIFTAMPEARDKFFQRVRGDNIFSPEFRAHAARVMAGFDMTLSMLDDPNSLNAQLAHLHKQHIDLDVDAQYLDIFNTALMDAVQARVGRCYDFDAWKTCTSVISEGIKH